MTELRNQSPSHWGPSEHGNTRRWAHACVSSHFSCAWRCAIPWTVACQASLSIELSRQEYWSGLPCSPPGESSWLRDRTCISDVSCISGRFFTTSATWEAEEMSICYIFQKRTTPPRILSSVFFFFSNGERRSFNLSCKQSKEVSKERVGRNCSLRWRSSGLWSVVQNNRKDNIPREASAPTELFPCCTWLP